MNKYRDDLKRLTETIIKPELNFGELKEVADSMYQLFLDIADLKEELEENRNHIYLSTGKAIGPVWAAMCIKEFMRTKRFLRGVYKGIHSALEQFKERPIHILYAGTGPFATLAVPFTSFFSSEDIKFTFLEINDNSINHLQEVLERLEIQDYVYDIIQCDASEFKVKDNLPVHMIISETMLNALQREPQVAITMNLAPQMIANGLFIPQNIRISAVLMDSKRNNDRMLGDLEAEKDYCIQLGEIFELNRETAALMKSSSFPEKIISIPQSLDTRYKHLCLFTDINVYGEEKLTSWQCSLTMPKHILTLGQSENKEDKVRFKYILDENPHFEWSVICEN